MRKLSFLLLFLLLLCSCGKPSSGIFYDGRELTEAEIQVLVERSTDTEAGEPTYTLLAFDESLVLSDGCVFWTENGSVFHEDAFCRHLTKAKEVYYGTVGDAVSCKKQRVCTACGTQK